MARMCPKCGGRLACKFVTGARRDSGLVAEIRRTHPLPKGRQLATLKDAGTYITKLPKAEHTAPEWQDAMEALILVATKGGPTMPTGSRRLFSPGSRTRRASPNRPAVRSLSYDHAVYW